MVEGRITSAICRVVVAVVRGAVGNAGQGMVGWLAGIARKFFTG